jgi:hypothetical protein
VILLRGAPLEKQLPASAEDEHGYGPVKRSLSVRLELWRYTQSIVFPINEHDQLLIHTWAPELGGSSSLGFADQSQKMIENGHPSSAAGVRLAAVPLTSGEESLA